MAKCGETCEVYSRIVGYLRPVSNWNRGKQEEFKQRKNYSEVKACQTETGTDQEAAEDQEQDANSETARQADKTRTRHKYADKGAEETPLKPKTPKLHKTEF